MATFILAFLIILVSLLGLAIGIIFSKSPIKGSCGGLSNVPGSQCAGCSKNHKKKE